MTFHSGFILVPRALPVVSLSSPCSFRYVSALTYFINQRAWVSKGEQSSEETNVEQTGTRECELRVLSFTIVRVIQVQDNKGRNTRLFLGARAEVRWMEVWNESKSRTGWLWWLVVHSTVVHLFTHFLSLTHNLRSGVEERKGWEVNDGTCGMVLRSFAFLSLFNLPEQTLRSGQM